MKPNILYRPGTASTAQPPLLFVHGEFAGAWCWDEQFVPFFQNHGYDCFALDFRGHGLDSRWFCLQLLGIEDYVQDLVLRLMTPTTFWSSPEPAQQHLNDDAIRIVEVDENPGLYKEAHIPGAIGFDWRLDLQDQVKRDFLGPDDFGGALRQPRDLERAPGDPVRGPQQLVRRIHVLVPEVLRASQRQAAERSARALDRRGPSDHDRSPKLPRPPRSPPRPATIRSAPSATRSWPRCTTTISWSTCARPRSTRVS